MPGYISVTLHGEDLTRVLKRGQTESPDVIAQSMMGVAQLMLRDATTLAPWKTRTLIKSATVQPPVVVGTSITIKFGFGGAASAYAEIQHDKFPQKRMPGRQWHYLSDPVEQRASSIGGVVVTGLEGVLR